MILLALEEFAAKRRADQERIESTLLPFATEAIAMLGNGEESWDSELMIVALREWHDVLLSEGGEIARSDAATDKWLDESMESLNKATPESDPKTVATWLATSILNAATMEAVAQDEDFIVMEWVTMHDSDVRAAHKDAEGQQRPPGEPFNVCDQELRYPGDPTASPDCYLNCRCALRPAQADGFQLEAANEGVDMDENETAEEPMLTATPWFGVLAPEGKWSGDGRMFKEDGLTHRDLPLPLTWQKTSASGHDGSVTVAKIERLARVDGEIRASGTFLATVEADEVVGMIAEFGRFGVSVDADSAVAEASEDGEGVVFTSARIASASIVAIPAFAEAYVALGMAPEGFLPEEEIEEIEESDDLAASAVTAKRGPGWLTNPEDTKRLHDYWTRPGEPGYAKIAWGTPGDFNRCRVLVGEKIAENSPEDTRFLNQICAQWHHDALGIWPGEHKAAADSMTELSIGDIEVSSASSLSLVAAATPAPAEWFENPGLTKPTPFTVLDDGQAFGHLATWGTCHIGIPGTCVEAPRSATNYGYFLTGEIVTTNGRVPVGQVTIGGGHAAPQKNARAAAEHYDSTSAAICDVAIGEDEHGIWLAGRVRPGADPSKVEALRASALSGDWRRIPSTGTLELVAALAVNVPGFPIPRAAAGIEGAVQLSLVAAGIVLEEAITASGEDGIKALAVAVAKEIASQQARKEKMAALAARVKE